jgi:hypothetical protein
MDIIEEVGDRDGRDEEASNNINNNPKKIS